MLTARYILWWKMVSWWPAWRLDVSLTRYILVHGDNTDNRCKVREKKSVKTLHRCYYLKFDSLFHKTSIIPHPKLEPNPKFGFHSYDGLWGQDQQSTVLNPQQTWCVSRILSRGSIVDMPKGIRRRSAIIIRWNRRVGFQLCADGWNWL